MRFKVQMVPKAVDNIVYSGFSSLLGAVCKLFECYASKARASVSFSGPLKKKTRHLGHFVEGYGEFSQQY